MGIRILPLQTSWAIELENERWVLGSPYQNTEFAIMGLVSLIALNPPRISSILFNPSKCIFSIFILPLSCYKIRTLTYHRFARRISYFDSSKCCHSADCLIRNTRSAAKRFNPASEKPNTLSRNMLYIDAFVVHTSLLKTHSAELKRSMKKNRISPNQRDVKVGGRIRTGCRLPWKTFINSIAEICLG